MAVKDEPAAGDMTANGNFYGDRGAGEGGGAAAASPGTLFLCPTPIGNLEDITARVLRVLREVDVIAAEDTRRTLALLRHFGIETPVTSLHRFNEEAKSDYICGRLEAGETVALVSDAGTPAVSDPGEVIVRRAIERGIPVVALPGPSAVLAALSVSGLSTRRFAFEGFLPRRGAVRRRLLEELAQERRTLVFFEAPHRIQETLEDMYALWGDRRAALVRELTKVHEEVLRGRLGELLQELKERPRRGEMVLVVEGWQGEAASPGDVPGEAADLAEEVRAEMAAGKTKKEAIAAVAKRRRVPKRLVYEAALSIRGPSDP